MIHRTTLRALIPIFIISAPLFAAQNPLNGHWEGAYSRDGSVLLLRMDLQQQGDSIFGTFDVPELSLWDEPVEKIQYDKPYLSFFIRNGTFKMLVYEDVGEMTGVNDNWGPPVRLHLKRTRDWMLPFYRTEDVRFTNGDITLAGTLIKPVSAPPYPVVVMIHGSGDQGRSTWRYRALSYLLARNGVASLIYDKRGVGESTGDYEKATFEDLADDALAGVSLLKKREDIIPTRIGLLGISQGGWIAPIAANKSKDVAYVVLLVGPAVSLYKQDIDATEYSMRAEGFSEAAIDSAVAHQKLYYRVVEGTSPWDSLATSVKQAAASTWKDYVQSPDSMNDADMHWWRRDKYDPAETLSHMRCPVLSIFGEIDPLVPPATNEALMKQYLARSGVKSKVVVIPSLPHGEYTYQTLKGGAWDWPQSFWVWPKRPELLDQTILDWVKTAH